VQRSEITPGRRGAGRSARSGHVIMQAPHAVHDDRNATVTGAVRGSRAA
jgi:hypothetical protein